MEVTQQDKAYIYKFLGEVRALAERKIFVNKEKIKELNIKAECHKFAERKLGNDIKFLQNGDSDIRVYIRDMFGASAVNYFVTEEAEVSMDIDHAFLFYWSLAGNDTISDELLEKALGVFFFIAGNALDAEFTSIAKASTKGYITPSYYITEKLLHWKKCPFIFRKYMLHLSQEDGYDYYYFERPENTPAIYLANGTKSFDVAKEEVKNLSNGLFYTSLSKEFEMKIMNGILTNQMSLSLMDGRLAPQLIKDTEDLSIEQSLTTTHNVMTQKVNTHSIKIMGQILTSVTEELDRTKKVFGNNASIYYLSMNRVGLKVRKGIAIQDILPTFHQFFNEVDKFSLGTVLKGDVLY